MCALGPIDVTASFADLPSSFAIRYGQIFVKHQGRILGVSMDLVCSVPHCGLRSIALH